MSLEVSRRWRPGRIAVKTNIRVMAYKVPFAAALHAVMARIVSRLTVQPELNPVLISARVGDDENNQIVQGIGHSMHGRCFMIRMSGRGVFHIIYGRCRMLIRPLSYAHPRF